MEKMIIKTKTFFDDDRPVHYSWETGLEHRNTALDNLNEFIKNKMISKCDVLNIIEGKNSSNKFYLTLYYWIAEEEK